MQSKILAKLYLTHELLFPKNNFLAIHCIFHLEEKLPVGHR